MPDQGDIDRKSPPASRPQRALTFERVDHEPVWRRFWSTRELAARNELVLAYAPTVRTVVSRLPASLRSYWEADDLVSFGILGLVEAIERWEEFSPLDRFIVYATKRIRGAIFDELRRLDWLPRNVRQRVIAYRTTVDSLSNQLGRTPATEEVLVSMGIGSSGRREILSDVQSAQLLHLHHSVDAPDAGEDLQLIDLIVSEEIGGPEAQVVASETFAEIRQAVTRLPERQRAVVTLHFLDGMTQEQIGRLLGVSNSRVCQIQASALQTLRLFLHADDAAVSGEAR